MKHLCFIFSIFICQIVNSQTYNLTLTINNIQGNEGEIQIGIYNQKNTFPDINKEYKMIRYSVKEFSNTYVVRDLPKGDYAIAVYHDKNSDGKCNTGFLGIPNEGYGFSNNYKPIIKKPSFRDCKIDLSCNLSIAIKLIY